MASNARSRTALRPACTAKGIQPTWGSGKYRARRAKARATPRSGPTRAGWVSEPFAWSMRLPVLLSSTDRVLIVRRSGSASVSSRKYAGSSGATMVGSPPNSARYLVKPARRTLAIPPAGERSTRPSGPIASRSQGLVVDRPDRRLGMRDREARQKVSTPGRPQVIREAAVGDQPRHRGRRPPGSPGGTSSPVRPWVTTSGMAPTSDETTGIPKDMASIFVNPKPSAWVGMTNASARGKTSSRIACRLTSGSRSISPRSSSAARRAKPRSRRLSSTQEWTRRSGLRTLKSSVTNVSRASGCRLNRLERLDQLKATLALEVASYEQEPEVLPGLFRSRRRGRESGIHDVDLVCVGPPLGIERARPLREDVRPRRLLEHGKPLVDTQQAKRATIAPEALAHPFAIPSEVVLRVHD